MGQAASIVATKRRSRATRTQNRTYGRSHEEVVAPAGLLDNCILLLPKEAVEAMKLTPNIEDKEQAKVLWFGRMWQIRQIQLERIAAMRRKRHALHTDVKTDIPDDFLGEERLYTLICRLQAVWRGAAQRLRCSFHCLEAIGKAAVKGCVVYMHGSGGMTVNNLRYARMLAGMGYLVIAPDSMASNNYRNRVVDQSAFMQHDSQTDYWASNLLYKSDATGDMAYNTDVQQVLAEPEKYKKLYEKVFNERSAELGFTLRNLAPFMRRWGVFLMGTSEGAMTLARYDDSRYSMFINGRIISAFSVEHTYFTPQEEGSKFGGDLDIPTLNLIGTDDQYFGPKDSVAMLVASSPTGYGARDLTGNAFKTMKKQGMSTGLVCVLDRAKHDPTLTHDNFIRTVLELFLLRPHMCYHFGDVLEKQRYFDCDVLETERIGRLAKLEVSWPRYPACLAMSQVEMMEASHVAGSDLDSARVSEDSMVKVANQRMRTLQHMQSQAAHNLKGSVMRGLAASMQASNRNWMAKDGTNTTLLSSVRSSECHTP